MWSKGGYQGTVLRIDLSTETITKNPLDKDFAQKYIGGTGFVARVLWDETDVNTDPLSPENRLVIAGGPITGCLWPGAGRTTIGAKSPLTGIYADSNFGGHFGPEMKSAGYDMIIVHGKAKPPVYIWIDNDNVEIRSANNVWGKGGRGKTS